MITLSTVTVQSVYSRDQTLELVSNLVYRDSFDALAELFDSTGKPFTGTFKQEASLVLFPVQRGRIMPMPRIKVHFVERGDAVSVLTASRPTYKAVGAVGGWTRTAARSRPAWRRRHSGVPARAAARPAAHRSALQ